MWLNLDSLLPWFMEVRFTVGLTAAFFNMIFFSNMNFYSNAVLPHMGKGIGFLTEKYPKSIQGKTYSTLKNNPQVLFSMLCFTNLFHLCYLILFSHNSQSTGRKKGVPYEM